MHIILATYFDKYHLNKKINAKWVVGKCQLSIASRQSTEKTCKLYSILELLTHAFPFWLNFLHKTYGNFTEKKTCRITNTLLVNL